MKNQLSHIFQNGRIYDIKYCAITLKLRETFVKSFIALVVASFLLLSLGKTEVYAKTMTIGVIELIPFGYTLNKKPAGAWYELANLIVREAGFETENKVLPYPRVIKSLVDGKIDVAILFTNPTLEKHAVQVAGVYDLKNVIVGRVGTEFKSLKDLHGLKVGTIRGSRIHKDFDLETRIRKHFHSNYDQSMNMLFLNRINATLGPTLGIHSALQNVGRSWADLGAPLIVNTRPVTLHFSKKSADAESVAALRAAFKRLTENGEIDKLMFRFTGGN